MSGRRVHLIGVCGTAMASLAGLLKQRGFAVTGSDAAAYPPMADFLSALKIPVAQPYAEANLAARPDFVVVGNAISRGNPELEFALDERIPLRSLPQTLADHFLRERETVVVAGTHGKTTTTSMLAWIFHVAGRDPSFLVGGIAENFSSSFGLGEGSQFILEGDEYDSAFFDKGPKFLHYMPQAAILTSVEFDHADIYADLEAVKTVFRRLVNLVPRRGRLVAWDGDPNVEECLAGAFCPVERYGFSARAEWRATDVRFAGERTTWRLLHGGTPWAELEFSLAGEYNVLNATAAAAMAAAYGIESDAVVRALQSFKSVKRRLEVLAVVNGITLLDDFAHHPTAIAGTLQALLVRYPGARLWAIFEPRSNTLRRKIFQPDLVRSLSLADQVVIAEVFRPEAIPQEQRLSVEAVAEEIARRGKAARTLPDADAIVAAVTPELRSGDVVVILSNGGFGGLYEKLPRRLRSHSAVGARA